MKIVVVLFDRLTALDAIGPYEVLQRLPGGDLVFANFVDFDTLYGHRRDASGYAQALEAFDRRLPHLEARLRPGDLVGAIANESGLTGRQIGPIRISEKHSVVGVPKADVDRVINAMDRATMRGKPVKARPYTD